MTADVKDRIVSLFGSHQVGTLSTVRNGKPYSRFMLFFHNDLVLYAATHRDTHKTGDLKENPEAHILLGYAGWHQPYVEVEATVYEETDTSLKHRFWNDELKAWLTSPDDPNYTLLRFQPTFIRYFEKAGADPTEMRF